MSAGSPLGKDVGQRVHFGRSNPSITVWVLAFVYLLSASYMGKMLLRSWAPEDEGTLAQPAERVLQGELPHRDFDDVYTGGEAYLNALAFRIFGIKLVSLRYMLYVAFLAWVPVFYYVALKFSTPLVAGGATLLAVAWSIPNYPAALPSWYNLILATFGLAALLQQLEHPSRWWLALSGVFGGASFLCKQSGLFFIAAALLYLLFSHQHSLDGQEATTRKLSGNSVIVILVVTIYESCLILLIKNQFNLVSAICFLTPASAVGFLPIWCELHTQHKFNLTKSGLKDLLWFTGGVLVVLVLFSLPYVYSSSVSSLIHGIFVSPEKRFAHAFLTGSKTKVLIGLLIDLSIGMAVFYGPAKLSRWTQRLSVPALAVVVLLSRKVAVVLKAVWAAIWMLLPLSIVIGVIQLATSS